jgi:hypothetical protein
MSYSRKYCDLAPYHITPGGPHIPGEPARDPRDRLLHLDGDFSRLDLKWRRLRDYERLILCDLPTCSLFLGLIVFISGALFRITQHDWVTFQTNTDERFGQMTTKPKPPPFPKPPRPPSEPPRPQPGLWMARAWRWRRATG